MEHLIGRSLGGRYRIDTLLGQGGMGAVLKGHDVTLKRDVAIKVMLSRDAQKSDFRERFLQEARAAAQMNHPSIVGVHDFGQEQSILYIVMEFIAGDNLRQMLMTLQQKQQWIDQLEAIQLVRQVSLALDYVHRQGILHRDIKPANIMLKPEASDGLSYRPVITDLGLAKLTGGEVMTQAGSSMGTPPYMSPEQALGEATDARSDVYSLGILLYELTVGRLPFPVKTITEAIRSHTKEPPPPPRTYQPDLPEAVEQVILKALEKAPEDRYTSGDALATALSETLSAVPAQTAPPTAMEGAVSLMTRYQESLIQPRGDSIIPEFPSRPAEVQGDRIVVLAQDKSSQTVPMQAGGLTIGRKSGNNLVLDEPNVSGQHAKITFDGVNYRVTDMDSTNGTYLANVKLLPGVPEIWTPDKVLRIGKNYLRLERGKALAKSTVRADGTHIDPSQLHSSAGEARVAVAMDPLELAVEPGSQVRASLEIINQGTVVDHFQTTVEGVPTEWVTISEPILELMPGGNQTVTLTFQPPRTPRSQAQTYPLTVRATSQDAPDQVAEVTAVLSVAAYQQFICELRPQRIQAGKAAQVILSNQGNAPQTFTLRWQDRADELAFEPLQTGVTVQGGEEANVEFRATPRRRPLLRGKATHHQFSTRVDTPEMEERRLEGEVVSQGRIPVWLLFSLFLCICFGGLATVAGFIPWGDMKERVAVAIWYTPTSTPTHTPTLTATPTTTPTDTPTPIPTTNLGAQDDDSDGLTNDQEANLRTNPYNPDSDGDGLLDGAEVNEWQTDPNESDTDEDDLEDNEEVNEWGTDPNDPDSDGDTLLDGAEVNEWGTDPTKSDTDADDLEDGEEVVTYETDPNNPDSDGDQLDDGVEVGEWETDPNDSDTDGDGITDGQEVNDDTDPTKADAPTTPSSPTQAPPTEEPPTAIPTRVVSENPLVLAHYFAWYDNNTWNSPCPSDRPSPLYNSDTPTVIAGHVQMARSVGLNGFLLHWLNPGGRTDRNFSTLLETSRGTNFRSTVVFSYHFSKAGPSQTQVIGALNQIVTNYSTHPNFLSVDEKPVLFFIDMSRVPTVGGQSPAQAWATIRDQVDPTRQMLWIAEGLPGDTAPYLTTFDGLYVFKISHAAYPHDYRKSSRWANQIPGNKLWLATISPGWDDTQTKIHQTECEDIRIVNEEHKVDRGQGTFYQATFDSALASNPDWLMVVSFNEWIEGTYIEPGQKHGGLYLEMTKEFVRTFTGQEVPDAETIVVPPTQSTGPTEAAKPADTTSQPSQSPVWADKTAIRPGECTYIRWYVQGIKDIHLDGDPITGEGNQQVCPDKTTTYVWDITNSNGSSRQLTLKITVN